MTEVRRKGDGYAEVKLSVLDGDEPMEVCQLVLDSDFSSQLFNALLRRDRKVDRQWENSEGLGTIMEVTCMDIDNESLRFHTPHVLSILNESGRGDTSQLTDVVEVIL
jgi:hypothetical protein